MARRSGRTHGFWAAGISLGLSLYASALLAYEARLTGPKDEDLVALLVGGSLLIEKSTDEEPLDVREIVSIAQADYKRILAILYDEGFFGPDIRIKLDGQEASEILAVEPPTSVSKAVITVTPGRKFRFGKVEVVPVPPETTMPEGFKKGETARISVLPAAAQVGVRGWRNAGHAKAEVVDQKITARHDRGEIDAKISIAQGPRLRFGRLSVEGESAVRRERILEIAGLPEGEVFSPKELEDSAKRLRRTGAFRSVAVLEGPVQSGTDTVPTNVRVTDNKPRRFGFGGELATIEGLTLRGFWLHRNLFGGAESLRFDAEIGGIGGVGGVSGASGGMDYLLRTRFQRPATFGEDINYYALAEMEQEDESSYFSRQASIETGIEWVATDQKTYTFGTGFRRAITEDAFGRRDYSLFELPVGGIFDYRDNELNARRGYYIDAQVSPFLALTGTDNGVLTELDLRTYHTFGKDRAPTLALRAQLGSVAGPSLENAPADYLFYSGGGGTVRGHGYQSLGVQIGQDEDDIVGGRSFLGLTAELRMRTSGSLGYVGFVDAGFIGRNALPDSAGEWQSGAGVGIRYATPIGPLRFDFAVPTSGDDGGESFQLYFGIGHSF